MAGAFIAAAGLFSPTAGGSDVTPIMDDTFDDLLETVDGLIVGNVVTFTGITTTITLRIQTTVTQGDVDTMNYRINGASYTAFPSTNFTISISNGDTLRFRGNLTANTSRDYGTVTITNDSDGGAAIDSFAYDVDLD